MDPLPRARGEEPANKPGLSPGFLSRQGHGKTMNKSPPCVICGRKMTPTRSTRKTCSDGCRQRLSRSAKVRRAKAILVSGSSTRNQPYHTDPFDGRHGEGNADPAMLALVERLRPWFRIYSDLEIAKRMEAAGIRVIPFQLDHVGRE